MRFQAPWVNCIQQLYSPHLVARHHRRRVPERVAHPWHAVAQRNRTIRLPESHVRAPVGAAVQALQLATRLHDVRRAGRRQRAHVARVPAAMGWAGEQGGEGQTGCEMVEQQTPTNNKWEKIKSEIKPPTCWGTRRLA
jgi:hypothetical protein